MTMLSRIGFLLATAVFLADRISKWWIVEVFNLPAREEPVPLLPFLDLTMVWNRGMSLGLFQLEGDAGRTILIVVTGAVAVGLSVWLWRVRHWFLAVALGLVVGGAAGNIWDRFEYGAVADFVHLHGFKYVFNLADSAISVGVAMLLWDALLSPQKKNT